MFYSQVYYSNSSTPPYFHARDDTLGAFPDPDDLPTTGVLPLLDEWNEADLKLKVKSSSSALSPWDLPAPPKKVFLWVNERTALLLSPQIMRVMKLLRCDGTAVRWDAEGRQASFRMVH